VDVTICIRTKNEEKLLERTLEAVFSQHHPFSFEVIVMDSESDDTTVSIARRFPARVYTLPRALFTYSSALNAGVQLSRGEYFVALSGHAVPADSEWLTSLIAPLRDDGTVGMTYSKQMPWPDVSGPEQQQLNAAFSDSFQVMTGEAFTKALAEGASPYETAKCSNASGAYRKALLSRYPFREVPFSEDRCTATELLIAGHGVAYVPTSCVIHSHRPDFGEFRHIARRATIARAKIDALAWQLTGIQGRGGSRPLSSAVLAAKIPLYTMYLSIALPLILSIPARRHKEREILWRLASLGTTVGKLEGSRMLASQQLMDMDAPRVADPAPILAALKEVS